MQTTYLKILDGRASHQGRGNLKPWLFAVIRRTAAGHRRRAALRLTTLRRLRPTAAHQADPESAAVRGDETRRIQRALSILSRRQRQVIELVFYHGLSLRQAAGVMGITLGAARSHYHRAKLGLLAKLAKGDRP